MHAIRHEQWLHAATWQPGEQRWKPFSTMVYSPIRRTVIAIGDIAAGFGRQHGVGGVVCHVNNSNYYVLAWLPMGCYTTSPFLPCHCTCGLRMFFWAWHPYLSRVCHFGAGTGRQYDRTHLFAVRLKILQDIEFAPLNFNYQGSPHST